jgi:hypothetical protein
MAPTIAVTLPPADVTSPLVPALLETCTLGAQPRGQCILGQDAVQPEEGTSVAIVAWDGPARTAAHVEVGLRRGARQAWRTRDITFAAADAEIEKWRTVGFAIATVAEDLIQYEDEEARPPAPGPDAAERVPPGPPPPAGAPDDGDPRSWLDAVASIETGAASSWAFGGELRFAHMLDARRLFVTAGASCTVQRVAADGLSIVRPGLSADAGVAALRLGDAWRVAIRAGIGLQFVEVAGTDPATGLSSQAGRWRPGLEQAVDGSWIAFRTVGFVVTVQAAEALGAFDVRDRGQLVARLPGLAWAVQGGVRFAFP